MRLKGLFASATVAAFLGLASPGLAQNLSGNDLLSMCSSEDDLAKQGYCIGYISGLVEGMKWGIAVPMMADNRSTQEADQIGNVILGFCLPEGATIGQYVDVVRLYLENNPADRHGSARVLGHLALQEAFPCE